jgi:hypothetical protein
VEDGVREVPGGDVGRRGVPRLGPNRVSARGLARQRARLSNAKRTHGPLYPDAFEPRSVRASGRPPVQRRRASARALRRRRRRRAPPLRNKTLHRVGPDRETSSGHR